MNALNRFVCRVLGHTVSPDYQTFVSCVEREVTGQLHHLHTFCPRCNERLALGFFWLDAPRTARSFVDLPPADLLAETELSDDPWAGVYYRADTVVRLLRAEAAAHRVKHPAGR